MGESIKIHVHAAIGQILSTALRFARPKRPCPRLQEKVGSSGLSRFWQRHLRPKFCTALEKIPPCLRWPASQHIQKSRCVVGPHVAPPLSTTRSSYCLKYLRPLAFRISLDRRRHLGN